jgi:hypothetical protein
VCDIAENCTGASENCPANAKSTVECRASAGVCDIAESCDGINDDCTADVLEPDGTACDDELYCTQVDECQDGQCIGSDDPCIDNGDYCDGVEYCQEDIGDYLCSSTGNPCAALTCDDTGDACSGSDVTLIVVNTYGYAGTIDIELENASFVSEVHVDICDVNQRAWLQIETGSCTTTTRSTDFSCTISDLGSGCVRVDLTTTVSGLIDPGTGAIAQLSYTLGANAPIGDFAHLSLQNSGVKDDTSASLSVTPKPGMVGPMECVDASDCDDGLFCNGDETCVDGICEEGSNPCTPDEACNEKDDICEPAVSIEASTGAVGSFFFLLPGVVTIQGMETDFTLFGSVVNYNPPVLLKGFKLVNPNTQTITQFVIVLPSILLPVVSTYPTTVTVTVDGLSDDMEIGAFPF